MTYSYCYMEWKGDNSGCFSVKWWINVLSYLVWLDIVDSQEHLVVHDKQWIYLPHISDDCWVVGHQFVNLKWSYKVMTIIILCIYYVFKNETVEYEVLCVEFEGAIIQCRCYGLDLLTQVTAYNFRALFWCLVIEKEHIYSVA